jgi:DNA (cytosine-5)-methyltransferase 1
MTEQQNIKLLYIDLFCGAGGTSTGVEMATVEGEQCAKVIACVNHDANAIASHAANHPDALHFTEDIRTLDLSGLIKHIRKMKSLFPEAYIVLWASLECTNFSKAKGGQPRDADSRTLAEHLFRYIDQLSPDFLQIENVEEFMSWGELDEKGKPVSRDKGRDYIKWINSICRYGYHTDHRLMNSADYGAYTSRKRLFVLFAKHDLPIVFPTPTHCRGGSTGLFSFKKWRPVKDVLDFTDEGESIFNRKKPLVEATLERIYAGLVKFVAGGKEEFLFKYKSMSQRKKYVAPGVDDPCPTISTQSRIGVVQTKFIQQRNSGNPNSKVFGLDQPARTVTSTGGNMELVQTCFLSKYYSGRPEHKNSSIHEPAGTITTRDHHSFISAYYGNGDNVHSIEDPAPTVTTKDRLAFVDMQYGNGTPRGINEPAATLTICPKHNIIICKPWIMNTNFYNVGSSIDSPAQTVTANRKWHYLLNPQFQSKGGSVDNPCFTLIDRMDKQPPYLMTAVPGVTITISPSDSEAMRKIKEFMVMYGIVDIKMRMLRIPELKQIMGFPKDYTLVGTQAEQKKYIGNAVEVTMARAMCEALATKLQELQKNKIAI